MSATLRIIAVAVLATSVVIVRAADQAAPTASLASIPRAARTATIDIKDFLYAPRTLTIAAGTTVTWRNRDAEPHTVRGADELIRSGALDQDETYSVRFDKPGTYRYGCSIHPQMAGTIVVQ